MKSMILLMTFILVGSADASVLIDRALKAIEKSKHQRLELKEKKNIQKLIKITGMQLLENLSDLQLHNIHTPASVYLFGKRKFQRGHYSKSTKAMEVIPKNSFVYPEVLLIRGSNFFQLEQYNAAINEFNSCINYVEVQMEAYEDNKRKLYYRTLRDICILNIARSYHEKGDYTQSIKHYEMIEKTSFKWPYTLIEKAWIYHSEKNYNRSLGLLITYNSPLLNSYFVPEAEVLKTINYMNLCLYDDALFVIDRYFTYFKKRISKLDTLLNKANGNSLYFFNLLENKVQAKSEAEKDLVRKYKRSLNYLFDKYALKQLKRLDKSESHFSNIIQSKIERYIRNEIIDEINAYNKFSYDMFKLKIDIIQQKKSFIYQKKALVSNKARGSFKNVKRTYAQYFWDFRNEFWADELGDYSLGLESNCKTKRLI